jgi:acyl-coenzyme A thioesterase PaaI-like protein
MGDYSIFPAPLDSELDTPIDDCEPLDLLISGPRPAKYVAGEPNGDRIRVRYYWSETDKVLKGRVWFGQGAEGPPGYAHGGSVAALLDEVMGISGWASGWKVVAAEISVKFKLPTNLGSVHTFEGRVTEVDGRRIKCAATLCSPTGSVVAKSSGTFMEMRPEMLEDLRERLTEVPWWLMEPERE